MTRINTNIEALRGLRSVQNANNLLSTSLTRLSTGLKINSGKDNPSGLIASETLRSQVTSIEQSIKNSNRANNVIGTADSALGEISGLLNQIRGLVQEGLNDGALSQDEVDANQLQIDAALSAINRISANTTFAGDKLIDGSKAFTTTATAASSAKLSDFQISEAVFGANSSIEINATIVEAATKAELQYSGGNLSSAVTLELAGSKGSQVLFLGAASTTSDIADAVNSVRDVTGVTATIENSAPGELTVTNATAGSLDVNNSTAGELDVVTAGTINISRDAQAGFTQFAGQEANSSTVFTFTDARATTTTGDADTLGGQIFVSLVNTGGTLANAAVGSVDVDGNGDYTITINLADDGGGNTTSNLADIQAAIAAHAGASALISVDATGVNAATDTLAAAGATQLTRGQDTTNNDITFTDIRPVANRDDNNVAVAFIAEAANQTLAFSVDTNEFGDQTVNITLATDAFGNVTSTADDVKQFLDNDLSQGAVDARALLSATTSGDGSGVVQANAAVALSDVTNSSLTFTDGRATDANAVFNDDLNVALVNGGASQTLSAAFVANGDGGTLTVNLATDANGNVTSTADDIKAYIEADEDLAAFFQVATSGDGTGVVGAAASAALSAGTNGANNDLTFTDARATDSQGEFDETISVQFANGGANQSLGLTVTQDSDGNKTITFNLATDADGVVTSTAAEIADFLTNDTGAAAVEARALVSVEASGDGSGVFAAKGLQTLTGGDDGANDDVTFTDIRTGSPTNSINVSYTDPAANSQALSVTVGVDLNGDHIINVNLATDANGDITTTAADIADFIANDASAGAVAARALVSAEASGDGTGVVAARDAEALSESTGVDTVVFSAADYGSRGYVSVNVLSGSFSTTLDDGSTLATRDSGTDIVAQINGQNALGDGLKASVKTATLDASVSFNAADNTADNQASITVTGGGSLFQIGQEVSAAGQIGIGIEAVNTARLGGVSGKIFELGSGNGKSLRDVQDGNAQGADLVNILDQAINRISTLRGRLGAIQKNVIETNITSLGVALENISEARSQIVDTDFAEETAKLTKAQILSQASLSILSIANQNPNQVLSLLR